MTVQELNDAKFEEAVSAKKVVVDFWAPWCGPCKQIAPILKELSDKLSGDYSFYKVNIDENPDNASKYQIRSIPTLLLFKNGKVVTERLIGFVKKQKIEDWLENNN